VTGLQVDIHSKAWRFICYFKKIEGNDFQKNEQAQKRREIGYARTPYTSCYVVRNYFAKNR
jgi:hypothetical protein